MALRPVYSVQLWAASPLLTNSSVQVPDNAKIVLRDIDVWESSGAANAFMYVRNAAYGVLWLAFSPGPVNTRGYSWRGRQVYNPGQYIYMVVVSGSWDVQLSGYELAIP
jgi:hypothetical protein